MKEKLTALLLFGLGLTGMQAQTTVPTSGGNASGIGGSASYSVGQVFYTSNFCTNGSVAQGAQQTYEILTVTGIEDANGISLAVSAYPNPTTDFLNLIVDASTTLSIHSMNYQLFDLNGKIIETKRITGNETSIITSNLVPATYFLKVIQGTQEVKTFKIIKN